MQRFRTALRSGQQPSPSSQAPGTSQGPPPIPFHTHPQAPPRPTSSQSSAHQQATGTPFPYPAGAIYAPGQWPTPELSIYPIGPFRVLSDPEFGWTSQSIQSALDALGEGGTVYLPRSSHWEINETVYVRAYQELATEGYPTAEGDMAALEATQECRPNVVNCWDTNGTRVRNLVIDGKHDRWGREDKCGCIVQFGGPSCKDQWCDRCIIRNPRQWSCIQAFEGSTNIRITNCKIGPAGLGADVINGAWADGISFAASDSLVAGNEIIDATDGAIVVFQAPGTLITSNTIVGYSRLLLGGINMVDYAPRTGEYTHTRVVHNTILTAGSYIITGICQGPSAWGQGPAWPSEDRKNRYAVVARNLIHYQDRGRGRGAIGYGFAVSADIADWTCVENESAVGVVYEGDMSDCDWEGVGGLSIAPGPFVRSAGPVEKMGRLQKEFVPGLVRGLLGIKPGRTGVMRLFPGQLHLRPGEHIPLKQWMLEFCRDGEIIFRHTENGEIVWWAGSRGRIAGHEETAMLELAASGNWRIIDSINPGHILYHLSPMLPPSGIPGCTPSASALPSLRISDTEPHVQLLAPDKGIVLSSSYEVGVNRWWAVGAFICRPAADYQTTLVSVLSPYGQYMVLRTKQGMQMNLPLTWPLNDAKWQIVWQTPNTPLSENAECSLTFQTDGNLVIYSNGQALWASDTHGPAGRQACFFRWGNGSPQQPHLELLNERRESVWRI